MTIADLITKLQELPNQNKTVAVVVGNDTDDCINTSIFEIHHRKCSIELFVHADEINL